MFTFRLILTMLLMLGVAQSDDAAPQLPSATVPAAPARNAEELEQARKLGTMLRGLLAGNLPNPLVESHHGWGDQREFVSSVKMERDGPLRWRAVTSKSLKNDGHWQKVRVEAIDPQTSLRVDIRNVRSPEVGRKIFDAVVSLDVRMTYEQQVWKAGARLYAGETRARCRTDLRLQIELTDRIHFKPGTLLPDITFRVRVTQADLSYSDLVCEHTLGVGGDAAKLMGRAVHEFIKKVKPSLEADLLAKANAAIVKAADTKEVKLEFSKMLGGR